MNKRITFSLASGLLWLGTFPATAASQTAPAPQAAADAAKDNLAVKGYDVVAYFVDGKPVEGTSQITAEHQGKTYRFISAAHRDLFTKDPEAYTPQYDGYCAFGAAKGHKASVDPQSWAIVDGKLYLNSSPGAQKAFDKDRAAAIREADENWKALRDSGSHK